jgi:DNA-binding MarR family transcriptional regulator
LAVYQREIKKISEKLIQKIENHMGSNIRILNRDYKLSDLLILNQMAISEGERSIKSWAELLDIGQNETRAAIRRLVSWGDLERKKSSKDSREVLVGMTKRGYQVLEWFNDFEVALIDFVLRDLTVNEEKAVLKFLSKLNQLTVEKYQENSPLK